VACRAYLDATFDVDRVLTSIAIQNFGQAWDDNFHNWFAYQRNTDGKWTTFPWDQDRMYGEAQTWAADKSIYIGESNDGDTRNKPYNNRIKHTFITCHKAALHQKYLLLLNTVLKNSTTQAVMDIVAVGPNAFNRSEAMLQHGSFDQDTVSCESNLRAFFSARPAQVLSKLPMGLTAERTALTPDDYCFNTPKLTNPRPGESVRVAAGSSVAPHHNVGDRQRGGAQLAAAASQRQRARDVLDRARNGQWCVWRDRHRAVLVSPNAGVTPIRVVPRRQRISIACACLAAWA
jgi:hypothetical protein